MLPNYYSDEEWNDLTDHERHAANNAYERAYTLTSAECAAIIEELDEQMRDFGPIQCSDDYHDYNAMEAELDSWIDLLRDIKLKEREEANGND